VHTASPGTLPWEDANAMGSWTPATIASLATAGGTLVLATATFSAVRSANRSARVAERSLLAGIRPVLVPSRPEQPGELMTFGDGYTVELRGGQGSAEQVDGVVYLLFARPPAVPASLRPSPQGGGAG
jgi:hypothetical protein